MVALPLYLPSFSLPFKSYTPPLFILSFSGGKLFIWITSIYISICFLLLSELTHKVSLLSFLSAPFTVFYWPKSAKENKKIWLKEDSSQCSTLTVKKKVCCDRSGRRRRCFRRFVWWSPSSPSSPLTNIFTFNFPLLCFVLFCCWWFDWAHWFRRFSKFD